MLVALESREDETPPVLDALGGASAVAQPAFEAASPQPESTAIARVRRAERVVFIRSSHARCARNDDGAAAVPRKNDVEGEKFDGCEGKVRSRKSQVRSELAWFNVCPGRRPGCTR